MTRYNFIATTILVFPIYLAPVSITLATDHRVPVMVGGEVDFDACGGTGKVINLDPAGDNYLSVRSGPSSKFEEIDRLPNRSEMFLCDEKGSWYGIVYPIGDCGVMSPIENRQQYNGVCKSGWVFKQYIELVSG